VPRSKESNEQMRTQSRAQIIAAASNLFAENGYGNCKVSDVARAAGMSQGNVYWYFTSKEEILKAVLAEGFVAMEDVLARVEAHPGDRRAKLEYFLDQYIEYSQRQLDFAALLLSLLAHGGVPFLRQLGFDSAQMGRRYHQFLTGLLASDTGTKADPNVLAAFFFAFFNGLIVTYGKDWTNIPPPLLRATALRLLGVETLG
jgi:AcrR family transcriptional regulator